MSTPTSTVLLKTCKEVAFIFWWFRRGLWSCCPISTPLVCQDFISAIADSAVFWISEVQITPALPEKRIFFVVVEGGKMAHTGNKRDWIHMTNGVRYIWKVWAIHILVKGPSPHQGFLCQREESYRLLCILKWKNRIWELFYNLLLRSKEKGGKCVCTSFSGAAPAI